jgi:hypothetical protein
VSSFAVSIPTALEGLTETDNCSNLAAGAACTVTFAASASFNAVGSVSIAGSNTNTLSIAAQPSITTLDVAGTVLSQVGANTVTVQNTGVIPATISQVTLANGTSSGLSLSGSSNCETTLAPNASCSMTVTAAANAYGAASLSLTANVANGSYSEAIQVPAPTVTINNGAEIIVDAGTSENVSIENTGPFALVGMNLAVTTNPGSITLSNGDCSSSLAAGSSCSASLTAASGIDGSTTGSFNLTAYNFGSQTQSQVISVNGVEAIAMPRSHLRYERVEVQNNEATGTATVNSFSLSNQPGSPTVSLSTSAPAGETTPVCTAGMPLNPGDACDIWVHADPATSLGAVYQGDLTVNFTSPESGTVNKVFSISNETDLYAAGLFTGYCNDSGCSSSSTMNRIGYWDGSAWHPIINSSNINGVSNNAYDVALGDADLYVTGYFTQAGDVTVNKIAKWNGTTWSALGNGLSGIYAGGLLIAANGDVYVTGSFTQSADSSPVTLNKMGVYNGSSWSMLGNGFNYNSNFITQIGNNIYVGGEFDASGSTPLNRIGYWNGSSWNALGDGFNYAANAIAADGSNIYVGGNFTASGGTTLNRIGYWNGSSWNALGNGLTGSVNAIAAVGSTIYAGGVFSQANAFGSNSAVTLNRIGYWNGSSWNALGDGVNDDVYAIVTLSSNIYAGGEFTTSGSTPLNRVAYWNGSSWNALGYGLSNTVGDPYAGQQGLVVAPTVSLTAQ